MLLELCPPPGDASSPSFRLHLAFADLNHNLPSPAAWIAQLNTISSFTSELDSTFNFHLLDRAAGLGTLLEGVRVSLFRDDLAGSLGVRVHCTFVDSRVVEWSIPAASAQDVDEESTRLLDALERILQDVESMGQEETKRKRAVQFEEQQRQSHFDSQPQRGSRHQHTQSLEPLTLGRKWTHKRQKSFLHTIVSAVGSMITSQRSSPGTHSRNNSAGPILPTSFSPSKYPADYPFPVSPSPSPPLSPSHSPSPPLNDPSRSGTPSPDVTSSSCTSMATTQGHAPHTYTYGAHHHPGLPPSPWSPPSRGLPLIPPMPLVPEVPCSSSHHQVRMKEIRARIRTNFIDLYRRFILSALVFGFAKEAGLASDAFSLQPSFSPGSIGSDTLVGSFQSLSTSTSPEIPSAIPSAAVDTQQFLDISRFNPNANPPRASNFSPNTYSYHLWLLRSMLRSAEEEVREIAESCEMSVREDFLKAAQADFEVDVVDVDMAVDVNRSWGRQGHQVYSRGGVPTTPTGTPTTSPNRGKVSFESFKSGGGSPTKLGSNAITNSNGNEKGSMLTRKKSRGKLVKKRSVAALSGEAEKEKDGKGKLALIGNWGKSKVMLSPKAPTLAPATLEVSVSVNNSQEGAVPVEQLPGLVSVEDSEVVISQDVAIEDQIETGIGSAEVTNHLEPIVEHEDPFNASANVDITDGDTPMADEGEGEDQDTVSSTSHATRRDSSSGCGSLEGASITGTVSTGLTTPSGSEALSRCGSSAECESRELDDEEEDIGVAAVPFFVFLGAVLGISPTSSTRGSLEEDDGSLPPGLDGLGIYGNSLLSKSTGNLLDEPNPTSMSSTSLLIPTESSDNLADSTPLLTAPNVVSSELDTSSPDFQLHLRIRLNLHPAYTRLTRRVEKLRELLIDAEDERKERRDEELRGLDILEVRSRRRAWSAGVLKQQASVGLVNGGGNDFMPINLSVPFKSSCLALYVWSNEDITIDGWEYVPPPNPHPFFHGYVQRQGDTTFPSVHDSSDYRNMSSEGAVGGGGKMRKADMKMSMRMEKERGRRMLEGASMDYDKSFIAHGVVDDREDVHHPEGFVEFSLDADWNGESGLDSDEDGDELDIDLDIHEARTFGHQRRHPTQHQFGLKQPEQQRGRSVFEDEEDDEDEVEDLNDLSNIPPRPGSKPTRNHPPPARLFAVVEEEEAMLDDMDEGPMSAGTATEMETEGETEGEGDEFEFDNVAVARVPPKSPAEVVGSKEGGDETASEDDDEHFFADIHDISDIVGDIEDGLGRHRRHPHRRRIVKSETADSKQPRSSRRTGLDLRPEDLEDLEHDDGPYPYNSFDVDVEMGLGVGEGLRASTLEWGSGSDVAPRSGRSRKASLRERPRTPYPKEDEDEDELDEGLVAEKAERKRTRNHRRQWQTMLGSGNKSSRNQSEDEECEGIEIALEVEKPKPRFMPAVKKAFMGGRGSKAQRTESSDQSASNSKTTYLGGKPRVRTSSMYHRQPSPNPQLDDMVDLDVESASRDRRPVGPAGLGLPLGIGFGYGSYSNVPRSPTDSKPNTPGDGLSGSSLLYQPVRFAVPPDAPSFSQPPITPAPTNFRLPTKSLVASPPVFSLPSESTGVSPLPARPRKHSRAVPLALDLEGVPVDAYEMAGYREFGVLSSSGRSTPHSIPSPASSDSSTCSSASLPMSPFRPPSPVFGLTSSSSPLAAGSPIIHGRAQGLSEELAEPVVQLSVGGTWENASSTSDGQEFTLAMDIPRRVKHSKNYHLPSSLILPRAGAIDGTVSVGREILEVQSSDFVPMAKRGRRKSVLEDPGFFEPPTMSEMQASGEGQAVECA